MSAKTSPPCGCLMLGCPKCGLDGFVLDGLPAAVPPQEPVVANPPRSSRDRAKLDAANGRIVALEHALAEAIARADVLQSDCAARKIREDDLAKRLLNSERRNRDLEEVIARRADERKRASS